MGAWIDPPAVHMVPYRRHRRPRTTGLDQPDWGRRVRLTRVSTNDASVAFALARSHDRPYIRPLPESSRTALMADENAARSPGWHATTILLVRKGGQVVIGGDGQVTLGQTIVKANAAKCAASARAT